MMNHAIKNQIDNELIHIKVTEQMKHKILQESSPIRKTEKTKKNLLRYAAACLVILFVGTTTVGAVEYFSELYVNDEKLPALDSMTIVEMNRINGDQDEYGFLRVGFSDYDELKEMLGISLLGTEYSIPHDYMIGEIDTDNKDYAMIKIENYIVGDTTNYRSAEEEPTYRFEYEGIPYTYDAGEDYYSSVKLEISMILSEEQNTIGFDKDYLGMYEFVEQYTSEQGYKVNLLESTVADGAENLPENFHTKQIAVFVADGIRYELSGHVSVDTMKEIVDSMES